MTAESAPHPRLSKRSGLRPLIAAILFVAAYAFTLLAQELWPAAPLGLRTLVALLPAAAFLGFVSEQVRLHRTEDELERQIQLEALALGFVVATTLVMALGLLQQGGVLHNNPREAWAVIPLCYFLGLFRARRRYHA